MAKDQYKYFRIEARELLDGMGRAVLELEHGDRAGSAGEGTAEGVARILRMAHTLKGASRIVKQPGIADFAHEIEDIFGPYREKAVRVDTEHIHRALKILDGIGVKLATLDAPPGITPPESAASAPISTTVPPASATQQ